MGLFPDLAELKKAIAETQALNRMRSAIKAGIHQPREPHTHVNPHYVALAEFLGHDGSEVEVIFDKMLRDPNEVLRSQLEHILFVGKMFSGEEIGRLGAARAKSREDYEQAVKNYEKKVAEREALKIEFQAKDDGKPDSIRALWHKLIRDLQAQFDQANNQITALSPENIQIVRALDRETRHIRLPPTNTTGEFQIDWLMLHNCNSVHICVMMEKLARMQEA